MNNLDLDKIDALAKTAQKSREKGWLVSPEIREFQEEAQPSVWLALTAEVARLQSLIDAGAKDARECANNLCDAVFGAMLKFLDDIGADVTPKRNGHELLAETRDQFVAAVSPVIAAHVAAKLAASKERETKLVEALRNMVEVHDSMLAYIEEAINGNKALNAARALVAAHEKEASDGTV